MSSIALLRIRHAPPAAPQTRCSGSLAPSPQLHTIIWVLLQLPDHDKLPLVIARIIHHEGGVRRGCRVHKPPVIRHLLPEQLLVVILKPRGTGNPGSIAAAAGVLAIDVLDVVAHCARISCLECLRVKRVIWEGDECV